MAGNIDASFNSFSGVLDLGGDGAANAVEVAGNGNPGEVIVTPLVDAATGQQTLLEGAAAPILYTGVTGFASGLGAGNDELYIRDFVFSTGDVIVSGQAGADTIHIGKKVSYGTFGTGDVFVGGRVSISEAADVSNSDADNILLGRLTIQEELDIYGDLGDDYIDLYNVSVNGNITSGNTVLIHGQEGSDVYNIAYLNCVGGMQLTADTLTVGNDLISFITSSVSGRAYFDVWHGTNTVAINACNFYDKVEIYTETGADTIRLTYSNVSLQVVMSSFYQHTNNSDSITVQGCTIGGQLYIIAGAAYDTITILGNSLTTAYINAGADSDAVIFRYNSVLVWAEFWGGNTGYDVLYLSGNAFYGHLYYGYPPPGYAVYEFESIQP
jgi:hypothetical protein